MIINMKLSRAVLLPDDYDETMPCGKTSSPTASQFHAGYNVTTSITPGYNSCQLQPCTAIVSNADFTVHGVSLLYP